MAGMPFHDFTDVQLMATIGEYGSVRRAAEAVGISQPAASRRLHTIERRVDTSLLQLGPRGAELTSAGRFWALEANTVLRRLEVAYDQFNKEFGAESGRLRVAAGKIVADYLLPQWLKGWATTSDRHYCDVEAGNSAFVTQSVHESRVELGFCEIWDTPGDLISVPLVRDRLMLVVAPGHGLARRKRPISLEEVAQLALVHREPGSGTQQMLVSVMTARGLRMEPAGVQVDSITAVKTAAATGVAPAIVSELSVQEELATGALREIPIEGIDLHVWVHALYRRGCHLSRLAQSFLAHTQQWSASLTHSRENPQSAPDGVSS